MTKALGDQGLFFCSRSLTLVSTHCYTRSMTITDIREELDYINDVLARGYGSHIEADLTDDQRTELKARQAELNFLKRLAIYAPNLLP